MRMVVTGAGGMLGRALLSLPDAGEAQAFHLSDLAGLGATGMKALFRRAQPEVVMHLAAMTGVDACEKAPEQAQRANAEWTGLVAAAAQEVGARIVYPSTDYVFDGQLDRPYREDDAPSPLNVYGRTKLEGERHVLALGERGLVVRTSWLFGKAGVGKVGFVDRILGLARTRPELRVVSDERGRPTWARHLAQAILRLVARGESGIWNVANTGSCTWCELAQEVLRQAEVGTPVHPITAEEYGLPARRPKNSVLDLDKLWAAGYTMPNWKDALSECLRTRDAAC